MTDPDNLRPADPVDIAQALAFALRFDGRRRVHQADELMSKIVAERLVRHLERYGFVVMKRAGRGGTDDVGDADARREVMTGTADEARFS